MTENYADISNTETLHMYAIASLADALASCDDQDDQDGHASNNTSIRKRMNAHISALGCLMLVFLQVLVLNFICYEISIPSCAMNSDCNKGYFCSHADIGFQQPRCMRCAFLKETELSECPAYTKVWYSRDSTPHYNNTDISMNFPELSEVDITTCLSKGYCEKTSLPPSDALKSDQPM